jgi:transcription initiation factor TFIID subunit 12
MLYRQIEANPPDTQAHRDAAKKIRDFSVTLHNKMQATANRPQANPNQQRPPSQAPSQQSQADGSVPPSQPQAPAQTAPARPPVSENMRNHVNSFPYVAPATLAPPEAAQWIQEIKGKYLKALLTMENTAGGLKRLEAQVAARTQAGKPLTPEEQKELQIKKEAFQKNHGDAKRFVDQFRRQQSDAAAQAQAGGSQAQQQASHPPQGIAVPPRPTMNTQQPAQSQAMAQTEAVQAAMQAARNQQVNGGRPNIPTPNQQNELQQQQQNQSQPVGAANAANMPPSQSAQGGAPIKSESATAPSGLPHVNTALATAPHIQQMQNRPPAQNSPQSAVPPSATSVGPPKPLTHSDAVAHAARTYSSSQATGQPGSVMASHSHPPSLPRDAPNIKTNLMPIPKVLPPRATESPHPMQMPPTRPTYSGGPSGSGSGLMQQPVMQKAPGFNVEGDAERVLNKRKLDELIRQVTGGGEGLDNSEGLTPEVEDVSLRVIPFIISSDHHKITINLTISSQYPHHQPHNILTSHPSLPHTHQANPPPPPVRPLRSRRVRRPSHHRRLQVRQSARLQDPRDPRHPAHPRAQLQHPHPRLRVRRDPHCAQVPAGPGVDCEDERGAG